MKQKDPAFHFVRLFATLVIIYYHYSIELNLLPVTLANGKSGLGFLFVTVFFVLSGCLLRVRYPAVTDIRVFYQKRAEAVFPDFYILYLLFFGVRYVFSGCFFADRPIATLPLTLLGLDGYLSSAFPTWYLIGEWFLGAIIIMYVLFPLLTFFNNRSEWLTTGMILFLFLIFQKRPLLSPSPLSNVFSCLICFEAGMLLGKDTEKRLKNPIIRIAAAVYCLIYFLTALPFNDMRLDQILTLAAGVGMFILLYALGSRMPKKTEHFVSLLGSLSYIVFLVHHVMVIQLIKICRPGTLYQSVMVLLACYVFVFLFAYIYKKIKSSVQKSLIFLLHVKR